ncbi:MULTISPECIES: hypothetical protein [unclassified Synechocystis]|uniref:hypothetical protein n=1 Tax=unclassified Synechocystis TaxID=2640012 RepID=UPI000414C4E9|nr:MULTISPECIES: hypothetical protein [unclassified Synechocystis]AIE74867.1 hypothetical protein D082_23390 [Synechocystis sp. PCC 6714]MCT0253413.1 hypothetical protein [Synechocystis sp. CS-94]
MLHLAQITIDEQKNCHQLLVLASYQSHQCWQRDSFTLPLEDIGRWQAGALVLVQTDPDQRVEQIRDGLDWLMEILEIVPNTNGLAPDQTLSSLVKQEKRRVEAWRQEMAAKNLELTKRQIELETQRQQLKELELKLQEQVAT